MSRPKVSSKNLSVYYHTHWDREWYLPFRSYQVRLAEVVDEVLEHLEKGVLPCFTLDGQTVILEDYLELRPENRERLQRLISSGKISIGPWYVMPDEFLVSGESLIRNLMRGIREARAWGYHSFTGYLPDTFGHSADMPMILQGFGIDSAVLWRGVNPKQSVFQWQSPGGARVKTLHLTDGYFQIMLDDWTAPPEQQIEALDKLVEKLLAAAPPSEKTPGMGLMPMGGDHMGSLPAEGHRCLLERYPDLIETTPDQFMNGLNGHIDEDKLETITGELMDNSAAFLLPGVWSSRMYLKQANRKLEHRLTHKLEPQLAMVQTLLPEDQRPRYPIHELDLAWKTLLLNHPHDSICGCSVDAVHRENEVRFEQVNQLATSLYVRAGRALRNFADSDHWVVFNMGDVPYTGVAHVIEDANTLEDFSPAWQITTSPEPTWISTQYLESEHHQFEAYEVLQDDFLFDAHKIPLSHLRTLRRTSLLWVEDIPPRGWKAIPKTDSLNKIPLLQVKNNALENEFVRIDVGQDGAITLCDKISDLTYQRFLEIRILPEAGDSYNSSPVPDRDVGVAVFDGMQNFELHSGPLVGDIFLSYSCPKPGESMNFLLGIRLCAGSPLVEFRMNTFTDKYPLAKVQVGFSTASPIETVMVESHLGLVGRRHDPAFSERTAIPAEPMRELKTNTGPIQRFISTNGHSWVTEGLTEYEVEQDTLYLTLARGFHQLSSAKLKTRGAPAGPPCAVEEGWGAKNTNNTFWFAWMPTPEEPHQLYEAAARFYGNVWGFSGTGQKTSEQTSASMMTWDNPALVSSACYWVPGKGLILRLINTNDRAETLTFQPGFSVTGIHAVNFLEEIQDTLKAPTATIEPRAVQTFLFAV